MSPCFIFCSTSFSCILVAMHCHCHRTRNDANGSIQPRDLFAPMPRDHRSCFSVPPRSVIWVTHLCKGANSCNNRHKQINFLLAPCSWRMMCTVLKGPFFLPCSSLSLSICLVIRGIRNRIFFKTSAIHFLQKAFGDHSSAYIEDPNQMN